MKVSQLLTNWYITNCRELPWRRTSDPYKIWVSEIILQQTRIRQGISYYEKFIGKYPDIYKLADDSIENILKIWQGLGYYSRARYMHETAKIIVSQYDGVFPSDLATLTKLPGIGNYTAAAIASIAFGKPFPVVDGNVYRVLSRIFGVRKSLDTSTGKKHFYDLALKLLNKADPGTHNQAIMELGSVVCIPKSPHCSSCPVHEKCHAFQNLSVTQFPLKLKKPHVRSRYFNYLIIRENEHIYISQRQEGDIWALLFELPLIETYQNTSIAALPDHPGWKELFNNKTTTVRNISKEYIHKLSHQKIHAFFIEIEPESGISSSSLLKVRIDDLHNYAFPRLIDRYLKSAILADE